MSQESGASNQTGASEESRVSVVMPVYNSARFLGEALASIEAQTLPPFEVILVDGPSTDATPDLARAVSRGRYMRQSGKGMWNALNEGIDAARGELITFLSDDDIWMPDKTRLQVEAMRRHPEVDYMGGGVLFVRVPGGELPPSFREELLEGEVSGCFPEVMMVRRGLFDRLGKFDETHEISADIDWLSRARDAHAVQLLLPQLLLHKRVHADNLSMRKSTGAVMNREILRIMRERLARRRSQSGEG